MVIKKKQEDLVKHANFFILSSTDTRPDIHCWYVGRGLKPDSNGKFKCISKDCDEQITPMRDCDQW